MSEEPDKPKTSNGWKGLLGKSAKIVLIAFVVFFLMGFVGSIWPLEILIHAIFGSLIHASNNLQPLVSQWRSSLLPLTCLVVAMVFAHRFIRWWIKTNQTRMPWRFGHTAAATLLLLLGSAAAIAMSGITHQAAWLFSSPWLEDNRRTRQTIAINNAKQILLSLFEYETDHGRYPDTLFEAKAMDLPQQLLWVETGPDGLREPFIFLKAGHPSLGIVEPVVVSPVIKPYDRVAVGYSDCSVRTMTLKAWQKLAKEIQTPDE